MHVWDFLLDMVVLLSAAMVLGTLAEQLKQSAIIGYLLAGMIVGPNILSLVSTGEGVDFIAELGVTLLLFSIGLEFSFKRLLKMGSITYLGGTLQVLLTTGIGYLLANSFGYSWKQALVLGMMLALSSTACVIRVLMDEARLDSIYGRNAVGILLLQDLAVVPLMLITVALGVGGKGKAPVMELLKTLSFGVFLVAILYVLLVRLAPRMLHLRTWIRNRELPIILAAVTALGSSWAAHKIGISPSLGAFIAGLLLAETPFAAQIRADVASLKTILVTLFFAAIGLLVDPLWIIGNYQIALIGVLAVFLLKPPIIWGVSRIVGNAPGCSLSTAACLTQVGEFSFVLAQTAFAIGVIGDDTFKMVVAVTVLTLLITPYLVRGAPVLGALLEKPDIQLKKKDYKDSPEPEEHSSLEGHIIIVGFGPAGLAVAEGLVGDYKDRLMIVDLNPSNADWAKNLGVAFHVGDARQREFLEHLHISRADTVIITLPDPASCRQLIHLCKALSPEVRLLVRARYHIFRWEFEIAGAERVIDEESEVGRQLAKAFTREGEFD